MKIFKRKVSAGLAGLAALLFALPLSFAGTSPGSGFSTGSDDVTTSPIVAESSGPGFVLDVPLTDLQEVLRGIRGTGAVDVAPGYGERFTVTLSGTYRVRLSKSSVAEGRIRIDYRGKRGRARMFQRRDDLVLIQR